MKRKIILYELTILFIIIFIAADLRIYNVSNVPGWHNDEGANINLAANLLKGRIEYFGVQDSMLFPARMPLFTCLLAFVFHVFGISISALRILTGCIGIINVTLIYFILRKRSRPLALICGLIFAIFPKAVLYTRLGFSYNLLAMLVLILFWYCNQYIDTGQKKYAFAGAVTLSLCLLSELAAVAYIPVFIIVIVWKNWKDLLNTLIVAIFPAVLYTSFMLWLSPQYYFSDLQYATLRGSLSSLPVQFVMIILNSASIHQDLFMLMGAIGSFIFPIPGFSKRLILFLFLPMLIFSRSIPIGTLSWYYLTPLFPFAAIGVGLLFFQFLKAILIFSSLLYDQLFSRFFSRIPNLLLQYILAANNLVFVVLLIIAPFIHYVYIIHKSIAEENYSTILDPILAVPSEAKNVVRYINNHTNPDDLILASPSIAWALNGNATDWQISLAYSGLSTKYFPNDVSHDRFRFDPSYKKARYIIIDTLWMKWGEMNMEDLESVRYFAEKFPVVYRSNHFLVYQIDKGKQHGIEFGR